MQVHECAYLNVQEIQKLQWCGASCQLCHHVCAANNRLLVSLPNFNRTLFSAAMVFHNSP